MSKPNHNVCNALRNSLSKGGEHIMSQLIYDEKALVEGQLKQYDKFLHSRITSIMVLLVH